MPQGRELFEQVRRFPAEASAFWWLRQATMLVKMGGTVVLFDPFLSPAEGRLYPPLFSAEDATGVVDVVACTHDHLDHIDPVAVPALARHTGATFVAPRAHAERMRSLGVPADRLVALNDAETAAVRGVTFHAVKAAHEFFDRTPEGLYPHLGYVVQGAGRTAYHPGDGVWWDGLQAWLSRWSFDVMFLPINGRDAKRLSAGLIGNMVYQEAADLAGGLSVGLTVPMHYDMFAANSADPKLFVDYVSVKYPGRRTWVGEPGEPVRF
jgi:L-ascorbate metabolism protein UlaG (beta-lactamase superfamily)